MFLRKHNQKRQALMEAHASVPIGHPHGGMLITAPFWVAGVLLVILLFMLYLRDHPDVIAGVKTSLFTQNTVASTATGEFQLASDLYTARTHVCDVLSYEEGKREMTMILRYHVNVLYDMEQVRILTGPALAAATTGSGVSMGKRIEIHLPPETIEVVTEKFAGSTGRISDGELPGIEIYDMKGTFEPKEDDRLADAFLSLYYGKAGQVSIVRFLQEEGTVADTYLPHTSMLVDSQFSTELNKYVQMKRDAVVSEAEKSVVNGLGAYFAAIGYGDVVVYDADGEPIAP